MRKLGLFFFLVGVCCTGRAQAVFQSSDAGSGGWHDPASWTLVSGTSSTNYPVAGDTATITAGAVITVDSAAQCNVLTINGGAGLLLNSAVSILTVSNGLSLSGASIVTMNLGLLTVTGNATVGGASTITINQGAMTVIGVFLLTYPTSASGTTLVDVEGGVFSCVGEMTITATSAPAGRYAELRIGGSAVNLAGGLVTSPSANARINFTGSGTLSLAGLISISNPNSFIAGNGRVVYVGIPGSNQTIAPLTYYRLVITGVGAGVKQINGAVAVTDSLTLLTDTLEIGSGGSLTLSDGITLVRTAGRLLSAPVFGATANLVYNDVLRDTTGPEMPAASTALQQLTISDISGIVQGTAITVNSNLTLQAGPLITGGNMLTVANASGGTGTDPGVTVVNGYIIGSLTRTIGASAGLRIFPLGIDNQDYREFDLDYTSAPTTGGTITAWAVDTAAAAQSGLPLTDDGITITHTAPLYWEADAAGGLSGGQYTVTLTAGGVPGVDDVNTLRIVKRPSTGGAWILDGADGSHSGTDAAPVISRTGMSGFSQFAIGSDNGNTLPITLVSFTGEPQGTAVVLSWTTAMENDNLFFTVGHSTDGQTFSALGTVAGAGTSTISHSYTYIDKAPAAGLNYYRLAQTDAGGAVTYSPVILCTIGSAVMIALYPNPAGPTLTVSGLTGVAQLLDGTGRRCGVLKPGTNAIGNLNPGIYYVRWGGMAYAFIKQ